MKTAEAVAKTTLYLKVVDDNNGCVPDYHLKAVSERFGLSMEDCRAIRDIIQCDRLRVPFTKDKWDCEPESFNDTLYAMGEMYTDEHARLF